MRKLYVVLTLLMSSFFLYSSSVSADVITYEVKESEFDYVKTEDFINFRTKLTEYCNQNNCYYIIGYSNNIYVAKTFSSSSNISVTYRSSSIPIQIYGSSVSVTSFKLVNNELASNGTSSSLNVSFYSDNIFTYVNFLDTNIVDLKFSSNKNYLINYKNLSYEISLNSHFPTLYEIYLDYEGTQEEPEEIDPKAEIVTNFYVLIIDKIKLLTDYIATDYIILSALVIFIFVAVIGLVRRLK